jgi:hypothetical protein
MRLLTLLVISSSIRCRDGDFVSAGGIQFTDPVTPPGRITVALARRFGINLEKLYSIRDERLWRRHPAHRVATRRFDAGQF